MSALQRVFALERRDNVQSRRLECRSKAKHDARDHGDDKRECEYAIIQPEVESGEWRRLQVRDHELVGPQGKYQTQRTAGNAQQHTLSQPLANESCASG